MAVKRTLVALFLAAILAACTPMQPALSPEAVYRAILKEDVRIARTSSAQFIEEWYEEQDGVKTYYRRYLVQGTISSSPPKSAVGEYFFVSQPFAVQRQAGELEYFTAVPDVVALASGVENRGAENWSTPWLRGGMSGAYGFLRLLFVLPMEGRSDYQLLDELAAMDIRMPLDGASTSTAVPLWGARAQDLPTIAYEMLEDMFSLSFPFMRRPTHVEGVTDAAPVSFQLWADEQEVLLLGRFTARTGGELHGTNLWWRYGFEVERVLKGTAAPATGDLLNVALQYALYAAELDAYFPTAYYPEPQPGQLVLISIERDDNGDWTLARTGRQVAVMNVLSGYAVPRQWRVEDARSTHVYMRGLDSAAIDWDEIEALFGS